MLHNYPIFNTFYLKSSCFKIKKNKETTQPNAKIMTKCSFLTDKQIATGSILTNDHKQVYNSF